MRIVDHNSFHTQLGGQASLQRPHGVKWKWPRFCGRACAQWTVAGEGQNRAGVARVNRGQSVADTCTHTFKTLLPQLLLLLLLRLLCCLPAGVGVPVDWPVGLSVVFWPVGLGVVVLLDVDCSTSTVGNDQFCKHSRDIDIGPLMGAIWDGTLCDV
jgi:hypothetical protein